MASKSSIEGTDATWTPLRARVRQDAADIARDQCVAAGVAFFYKQKIEAGKKIGPPLLDGRRWMEFPAGREWPR
jgi:protein gp37